MARAGDRIDVWVVEQALGSGGMGAVYRCHNAQAPRILAAVKVLDRSLRSSDDAMARFVREAEILNRLDHVNVVRVRNVRVDAEPPFLEMEFVEGTGLDELIDQGPLPLERALALYGQVIEALVHVHGQHVRHRDIKPANLVVTGEDVVKLVDFGLAMETDLSRITQVGITFGTVAYAPPEWIDPVKLDPVSWDLYATGVVLYEMLVGVQAFPTPGFGTPKQQAMQVMLTKQNAPALDPGPSFPAEIRSLVRDLTSPTPEARPATALEVRERLAAIQAALAAGLLATPGSRTPMPSIVPTEVPAPVRASDADTAPRPAARSVLPDSGSPARTTDSQAPTGGFGRALAAGVVAAVAIGVAVGVGAWWMLEQPAPAPALAPVQVDRDVVVRVQGAPEGFPIAVVLDGKPPTARDPDGWRFERVPIGAHQVRWVAGDGCGSCATGECPAWCGTGSLPISVDPGLGVSAVEVQVEVPNVRVVVAVPAVLEVKGGLFRRKPDLQLKATLGGKLGGAVDDAHVAWLDVQPGAKELVVSLGSCPPDAIGCWPDRACPEDCTSTAREVVVPFSSDEVALSLELPAPK